MAFSKKDRKDQGKNFRFTFGLRVLAVSTTLLILPLIFHLIWMYRHDNISRERDLFLSLSILAESRSSLVDQIISSKVDFLELTNKNPIFYEPAYQNKKNNELNEFFRIAAFELEVSEIFYIAYNENLFQCIASSNPKIIDKSFVDYPFITRLLGEKRFVLFGVLPFISEKRLFIGNTVYDESGQNPIGIFITCIPSSVLAHRLAAIEDSPYTIDLSLLMEEGIIFSSSDPKLVMRSIEPLTSSYVKSLKESRQIGDLKVYPEGVGLETVAGIENAYQLTAEGKDFVVFSPVKNTKINVLLDVSEDLFFSLQQKAFLTEFLFLLFLIFGVGGAGTYLVTSRFSKPYKKLQRAMQKVAKGDLSTRYYPDRMGFEINEIGSNFNHMIKAIVENEKKATEERLAKEILANELKIGYEIQMSMLPLKIPEFPGLDISTGFIPAKEVGGDFYDLFALPNGKLLIAIADTAGKGISACLYSLGLRSILRSLSTSTDTLYETVNKANELFMRDTKDTGVFVTTWLGIYDPRTHVMQYCNAGHHPPYIKRNDKLTTLKTTGMALGVQKIDNLEVKEIKLEPNDQIVLFTDGVIDAQNAKREFFKEKMLAEILKITAGSSDDFIKAILNGINSFRQETELPDDLTIVAIKIL